MKEAYIQGERHCLGNGEEYITLEWVGDSDIVVIYKDDLFMYVDAPNMHELSAGDTFMFGPFKLTLINYDWMKGIITARRDPKDIIGFIRAKTYNIGAFLKIIKRRIRATLRIWNIIK